MRRRAVIALLASMLVFSSGCVWPLLASMAEDPMGRHAALNLVQRQYTNAVRFGDIEEAARFVHPELQEEFLSFEGRFDGIRVTDFDVGETVYGEGEHTASVRVTYHAYSLNTMLEKKIKETQEWERSGINDWVVRAQLASLMDKVSDLR